MNELTSLAYADRDPVTPFATTFGRTLPDRERHGLRPAVADIAPNLLGRRLRTLRQDSMPRINARLVHLASGPLQIDSIAPERDGWIGLLILDGLIVAQADAGRAHAGWLIGADDLVVPWDLEEISLTSVSSWKVLAPATVALLDRNFSARIGGSPLITRLLVAKAAKTSAWLFAKLLVLACPAVEERLLLVFALFGERWGIVRPDGILLRLQLTHKLLATLCGVRRPSVTLGLRALEQSGVLTRLDTGGWILRHERSASMSSRLSCWPDYARALGIVDD